MIAISVVDRESRVGGLQYYDPQEQAWTPRVLEMGPTRSGVAVSEVAAMKCLTVYACIRAISEDIAKLPMRLYQQITPRGHNCVRNRVSDLLSKQASPDMSAYDFKRAMQSHVLQWGNGFAEIEFNAAMQPVNLWLVPPDRMKVCRNRKTEMIAPGILPQEIYYEFRPNYVDRPTIIPAWKMLHVKGLGFDGLVGYSPIRLASENIGVSMAQERFAAGFFGNGAYPGVILTHPAKLTEEAEKRLKYSWEQGFRGSDMGNRTAVLQEGMKIDKMTLAPDEAQFLESRNFSVEEIARLFRVPPHKIGHLNHATLANIEEQNKEYATDCLLPHATAWEQECDRKLNLPDGQFFKHKFDELLRADAVARGTYYSQMRNSGVYSSNDIRDKEDMNPYEGGGGDDLFIQGAMVPLGAAAAGEHLKLFAGGNNPLKPVKDNPEGDNPSAAIEGKTPAGSGIKQKNSLAKIAESHVVLLADALARALKIESERALKASKKPAFDEWKAEFFGSHSAYLRGAVRPIIHNLALCLETGESPDIWTENIIARHLRESQDKLSPSTVDSAVLGWTEARAQREAKEEIEKLVLENCHA